MSEIHNIITLCGSTKFKDEFIEVMKWLTLKDNIVISVGLFGHSDGENLTVEEKVKLDALHKSKIDLSDEIFVINPGGYVGESSKSEIKYATTKEKRVRYLTEELEDFNDWKTEYYGRTYPEKWNYATVINL